MLSMIVKMENIENNNFKTLCFFPIQKEIMFKILEIAPDIRLGSPK